MDFEKERETLETFEYSVAKENHSLYGDKLNFKSYCIEVRVAYCIFLILIIPIIIILFLFKLPLFFIKEFKTLSKTILEGMNNAVKNHTK